MLDSQVIVKFKLFQQDTGKYHDLEIEKVKFEKVSLSNDTYFEFIKGKNKYIQRYITQHPGEYPILGSSLKNDCIASYIEPIEASDLVSRTCVSFNKDNAKGSQVFYRDYPFLMDRHHIAIVPSGNIDPKYLYYSLMHYFEKSNFGWGENVANSEEVQKHSIPIPIDFNEQYTSYDIQKIIVEFLDYSFENILKIQKNIDKHSSIISRLKGSLIPSVFKQTAIQKNFSKYAQEKGIEFNITDIEFEKDDNYTFNYFFDFKGGNSQYKVSYYTNSSNKGKYPLVTGSTSIVEYIKPIKQEDIFDAPAISYNKDNDKGSIAFYHDQPFIVGGHHYALILKKSFLDDINIKYSYYLLSNHFDQNMYYQSKEPRANSGLIKNIEFLKPKPIKNYSSYDIQKIIAQFITDIDTELQSKHCEKIERAYDACERLHRTYLARTFALIDWSES